MRGSIKTASNRDYCIFDATLNDRNDTAHDEASHSIVNRFHTSISFKTLQESNHKKKPRRYRINSQRCLQMPFSINLNATIQSTAARNTNTPKILAIRSVARMDLTGARGQEETAPLLKNSPRHFKDAAF
jgi:hypothetical protein